MRTENPEREVAKLPQERGQPCPRVAGCRGTWRHHGAMGRVLTALTVALLWVQVTAQAATSDVQVVVFSPASALVPGAQASMTGSSINHGPDPAVNTKVTVTLPEGITFVSGSSSSGVEPEPDPANPQIIWFNFGDGGHRAHVSTFNKCFPF